MKVDCKIACDFSLHKTFAILLFVCLAVAIFCAKATVAYLPPDQHLREKFLRAYRILGFAMLASPAAAWLLDRRRRFVFLAEAAGVVYFGIYWAVKSVEMKRSNAERRALLGEIRPPKRKGGRVLPTFTVE